MPRRIPIKEVRPVKLLSCNHFVAIVMLFSFHDYVTEVSFVWLHNFELWSPKRQNFALSVLGFNLFLDVSNIEWIESDFEWTYKKGLAPIRVTCI